MKILLLALLVSQTLCLMGNAGEWDAWVDRFRSEIEAMPEVPSPENVRLLATLGYPDPGVIKPETEIIREMAKERLRQIPDFPDKIAQFIEDEKAKRRSGGPDGVHADIRQGGSFRTMGRIPHPGVVRVLGEYLYDWDEDEREKGLAMEFRIPGTPSNGLHAMNALGDLIEKPPVQKRGESYNKNDANVWQLWYEQVKAGTRTFRFKGDPQEYSLAGPVDRAKEPVSNRPAKPPIVDTNVAVEEGTGSGFSWPVLLTALAVCGAGAWFVLKSSRSRLG